MLGHCVAAVLPSCAETQHLLLISLDTLIPPCSPVSLSGSSLCIHSNRNPCWSCLFLGCRCACLMLRWSGSGLEPPLWPCLVAGTVACIRSTQGAPCPAFTAVSQSRCWFSVIKSFQAAVRSREPRRVAVVPQQHGLQLRALDPSASVWVCHPAVRCTDTLLKSRVCNTEIQAFYSI